MNATLKICSGNGHLPPWWIGQLVRFIKVCGAFTIFTLLLDGAVYALPSDCLIEENE